LAWAAGSKLWLTKSWERHDFTFVLIGLEAATITRRSAAIKSKVQEDSNNTLERPDGKTLSTFPFHSWALSRFQTNCERKGLLWYVFTSQVIGRSNIKNSGEFTRLL
jgi:hypothetical protein